jgi:Domain of unknown function (DUF6456)
MGLVYDADQIGYDGKPQILEPVAGLTARERQARNCPKRNANHCVICWLLSQRLISRVQHEAAERLQRDHENAQISPLRGVNLLTAGAPGYGPSVVPQVKLDASRAYNAALIFAGEKGAKLLIAVVVEDLSLAAAAKLLGWNDKGALPALQCVLDQLATTYAFRLEVSHVTAEGPHQGRPIGSRKRSHRASLPG